MLVHWFARAYVSGFPLIVSVLSSFVQLLPVFLSAAPVGPVMPRLAQVVRVCPGLSRSTLLVPHMTGVAKRWRQVLPGSFC